jgi:hypothetical protein
VAVRPLDQLEMVAVGVDERHGPRAVGATRSLDIAGLEPGGQQFATRGLEVLDLDRQVVKSAGGDRSRVGALDEF